MDNRIKTIYLLIKSNKVLICESNLKDLFNQLPKVLEGIRTYDYYYRNFKKSSYFQLEFNREYYFQKIEYNRE
jgi:hypothetical protein